MRIPLLAAVLVVGCSTVNNSTDATYTRCKKLRHESQEISERERQCIRATLIRSNDQIVRIVTTPDSNVPTPMLMQTVTDEKDRDLSRCKGDADREVNELAACQRAEYKGQAKEERERQTLMMILTSSLPR